ncbi:MAG: hypothetical protein O2931_07095 [Planctomycetota bacterium]|nr:hypothetical protein [Planctomycetota bacterium]MDA1178546.1 hypothetical protein [Planctomycetota bacterium]
MPHFNSIINPSNSAASARQTETLQVETLQVDGRNNPRAVADFGDWVGAIVFIIITAAGLLNQLFQNHGKPARPTRRPVVPQSDAADEIRKFLEGAAQQQRQKQKGQQRQTADRSDSQRTIVTAEPVTTKTGIERGRTVDEHVQRHLGSDQFATKTSKLASADEQLESHLHEVFDHRLGRISHAEPVPIEQGTDAESMCPTAESDAAASATESKNLAREIAVSMKNPTSVRQAVIMSEILRRRDGVF